MAWIHYKKLIVWQKAMDLTQEVYRLSKLLPADEKYSLSDQLRRSAVSIPSNIAEGQGRQTAKEYKSFLSIAKGSLYELETQLLICNRTDMLSTEETEAAFFLCEEIGKILTKLISDLNSKSKSKKE